MRPFNNQVGELRPILGDAALTAAREVMRETTLAMAWDKLQHEAVFLQALRRYVAIRQGPVTTEQIETLLKLGQIVGQEDGSGTLRPLLTLVPLPLAEDVHIPVLYDVMLDASLVAGHAIPKDARPIDARAPVIHQEMLSAEQRAQAQVDEPTMALVWDTITVLQQYPSANSRPPTADEVVRFGVAEGTVRGEWSAHLSQDRSGSESRQVLTALGPDGGGQGSSIGGPFEGNELGLDVFTMLSSRPIKMTRREHGTYHFLWGFDCVFAINAVAHIRLSARMPSGAPLPPCAPMACAARFGTSLSPTIIIGFDESHADAIVIAPGLLFGTRRMTLPREAIKEGEAAFGRAVRAKAKLLDYELDDPKGTDIPIANSFEEAKLAWAVGSKQEPFPARSTMWDTHEAVLKNPAGCLHDCLAQLGATQVSPTHLTQSLAPDGIEMWEGHLPLENTYRSVRDEPLSPGVWFENLTGMARLAAQESGTKSECYPLLLRATIAQLCKGLVIARLGHLEDANHSLLYSVGRVLDDAAAEGYLSLIPELAKTVLSVPGSWQRSTPLYFEDPFGYDHAAELSVWLAACSAAKGDMKGALRLIAKLRRENPESADIRILDLGIRAAVDPAVQGAYIEAARNERSESIGYLRDKVRDCLDIADHDPGEEDEAQTYEPTDFVGYVAYGLHVPCAVAHAIVMGLHPEVARAFSRALIQG